MTFQTAAPELTSSLCLSAALPPPLPFTHIYIVWTSLRLTSSGLPPHVSDQGQGSL